MKIIIFLTLYSFTGLSPELCGWKGKMKSLIFIRGLRKYDPHFLFLVVKLLLYFPGGGGIGLA